MPMVTGGPGTGISFHSAWQPEAKIGRSGPSSPSSRSATRRASFRTVEAFTVSPIGSTSASRAAVTP
jgi:hypothetical protein